MTNCDYSHLIDIDELARRLPRGSNGKKINRSTIYRWTVHGVRGIKLRATRIGGMTFFDPADVEAFIEARSTPRRCESRRERTRGDDAARHYLDSVGLHDTEVDRLLAKVGASSHVHGVARKVLWEAGIKTADQLVTLSATAIDEMRGAGPATRELILEAIRRVDSESRSGCDA